MPGLSLGTLLRVLSLANLQFLENSDLDPSMFLWQEDVKLPTITEAESKMIDLDLADEEESSGDYLDDDQDIDKVEEEDDYEDDYDEVRISKGLQGPVRFPMENFKCIVILYKLF